MIHNYDRTAAEASLKAYVAKLKELKDFLENPPDLDVENLPKEFKATARGLKLKAEKSLRTAYHKSSEAYYDLRDLSKLVDDSEGA